MSRFEIVRTDSGWHSRFRAGNGQIVWTTEVYTRRRAAVAAIRLLLPAVWKERVGDQPCRDVDERSTS